MKAERKGSLKRKWIDTKQKMKEQFNIVKKTGVLFLIIMTIGTCVLTGCRQKKEPDLVKNSSDLKAITITLYHEDSIKVTNSEKIRDIVNVIHNAEPTKEESTQDVPDADEYGEITLEIGRAHV